VDEVGEVVGLEVWDVVGDDDGGEELEEDPVYSFNTLLNSVDVGVLDGDEEDGVGTGDEVGDVAELFCELGCELAVEEEVELDSVDVGVLDDDVEEEVELCELALWLLGVDVGEDGVEDVEVELCELVDVEEEVELCELALSMVFIASLRNCV